MCGQQGSWNTWGLKWSRVRAKYPEISSDIWLDTGHEVIYILPLPWHIVYALCLYHWTYIISTAQQPLPLYMDPQSQKTPLNRNLSQHPSNTSTESRNRIIMLICSWTPSRDDRNGHLSGVLRSYYVGARKKTRGSAVLEIVPLFTVECGLSANVWVASDFFCYAFWSINDYSFTHHYCSRTISNMRRDFA